MISKFSHLIFAAFFLSVTVIGANAQISASDTGDNIPRKEDFPKGIKETLAKSRIDREKKDYEELLQNGEEAVKISESLEKSFAASATLSTEDQKKLDRLEKLAKKIRRELGADEIDDVDTVENPSSMREAFETLQLNTGKLVDALKKTTRYSVSVVAIQSSNAFLRIVKFIRFGKSYTN